MADNGLPTWNFPSANANFGQNVNIDGTLTVAVLTASVFSYATLDVVGDFSVATDKFTVAGASGNTAIAGDVAVATNKFTIAAATGNTVIAGTLALAGNFALATNKFTVASATGNTVVAGTLGVAGATAFTAAVTTTDGVSAGTARKVGGLAYDSIVASTAITNTASETPFDTNYNMPAATLKAGTVVRVRYQGIATATNASDTLQIHLRIGGTTSDATGTALITSAATDATNNDIFTGEFMFTCRDVGATGHIVGMGYFTEVGAAGSGLKSAYVASSAVDTTAALPIKVTALWSAADPGNSCRLDYITVEVLG